MFQDQAGYIHSDPSSDGYEFVRSVHGGVADGIAALVTAADRHVHDGKKENAPNWSHYIMNNKERACGCSGVPLLMPPMLAAGSLALASLHHKFSSPPAVTTAWCYYRCTQDNCRVKKRVERLAEDPRMVITTYKGRHCHKPSHDLENSPNSSHTSFFW